MSIFSLWGVWLPALLQGLVLSLELTATSTAIALPLGLLLAISMRSRRRPWFRILAMGSVELVRGIPDLVIVYLLFFGLPSVGVTLPSFLAATLALGVHSATYASEIFRGGLQAIPAGQRDAARAIGLADRKQWYLVILPQMRRIVTPAILGLEIQVFQSTSLAFTIGVDELLNHAYTVGSDTFQFFSAILEAGLIYLAISVAGSRIVHALERGTWGAA